MITKEKTAAASKKAKEAKEAGKEGETEEEWSEVFEGLVKVVEKEGRGVKI